MAGRESREEEAPSFLLSELWRGVRGAERWKPGRLSAHYTPPVEPVIYALSTYQCFVGVSRKKPHSCVSGSGNLFLQRERTDKMRIRGGRLGTLVSELMAVHVVRSRLGAEKIMEDKVICRDSEEPRGPSGSLFSNLDVLTLVLFGSIRKTTKTNLCWWHVDRQGKTEQEVMRHVRDPPPETTKSDKSSGTLRPSSFRGSESRIVSLRSHPSNRISTFVFGTRDRCRLIFRSNVR